MGMFDELKIEYTMPPGYEQYQDDTFQTKSMECDLSLYTINDRGWLQRHGETVPFTGEIEFYPPTLYATFYVGRLMRIGEISQETVFSAMSTCPCCGQEIR